MSRPVGMVAALALVVLAIAPLWLPASQTRMLTEVLYLGLFALSFNFLFHHLGLLSFGHNLGFGVGAYAVAIYFDARPDGSLLVALPLAALAGCVAATLAGVLLVRLRGGYFALMTMALCQLAFFAAGKWRSVTRGEDGLMVNMPALALPGWVEGAVPATVLLCWLALAVAASGAALLAWYLRTPLGRATVLLRENEGRAAFLGYPVALVKLAAFNVAGLTAALAGAVFALVQGLVSPVVLGFGLSGDVIMMTLVGGSGSLFGPAIGAAIYTLVEDVLPQLSSHPRFVLAAMFVGAVLFVPEGISGLLARLRQRRRGPAPLQQEVAP